MSTVTIESIQAKQTELTTMIAHLLKQPAQISTIETDGRIIALDPGEHYAGAVLDTNGQHLHHLVLMAAKPTNKLNWKAAMDWAKRVGGHLPNRQEQALLFANCKPHLQPVWHWSGDAHEDDASYAWNCYFTYGSQGYGPKSYEGCAVAVRRIH